jgi:TRAP-type C4-dicarboxylate transport system permease small subunit
MLRIIDQWLIKILKFVVALLLFLILLLTLIQVVFRYILILPSPWSEELARLGLVWIVFLAASLGVRLKSHPYLKLLVTRMSFKIKYTVFILVYLFMAVMGIVMVVYGVKYVGRTAGDYTTSLGYSRNLFYYPVPISGIFILIYSTGEMLQSIKAVLTGKEVERKDL